LVTLPLYAVLRLCTRRAGVAKELDRSGWRRRYVRDVKLVRQLVAALMVLAWLCASAHVVLEHGGDGFGPHIGEALHGGDHDHDAPADDDDADHHDFGSTMARVSKSGEKECFLPKWVLLYEQIVATVALCLSESHEAHESAFRGDAPPDTREFGWLLAVQTARPVRGPSLVV
jgi:hypothetical protein